MKKRSKKLLRMGAAGIWSLVFLALAGGAAFGQMPSWPIQPHPPAGAPNVVLILLDDVGYGAAGTFGGPAATPELDRLAADGLRSNQFNTTAICSPTRAALLSGRNHHQVGFGNLQDVPAGYPGYNTVWKKQTASIAEMLRHGAAAKIMLIGVAQISHRTGIDIGDLQGRGRARAGQRHGATAGQNQSST